MFRLRKRSRTPRHRQSLSQRARDADITTVRSASASPLPQLLGQFVRPGRWPTFPRGAANLPAFPPGDLQHAHGRSWPAERLAPELAGLQHLAGVVDRRRGARWCSGASPRSREARPRAGARASSRGQSSIGPRPVRPIARVGRQVAQRSMGHDLGHGRCRARQATSGRCQ